MKIGDFVYGGIYAGDHDGHHIICPPLEYELPIRVNWFQANEYCKSISMELPTNEELIILYKLCKSFPEYFPNRKFYWYWSSTESSSTDAWYQYFPNGYQLMLTKTGNLYVRPIKRNKV